MSKVSVVTEARARAVPLPSGFAGSGRVLSYFEGEQHPLHLHRHQLAAGDSLRIGPLAMDCVAYIWRGTVKAGSQTMAAGSSMIVERGQSLEIAAETAAELLTFAEASSSRSGDGGHVHLLPSERVPTFQEPFGSSGTVTGRMHADSLCPTCNVWLHENHFVGEFKAPTPEETASGVHCHSEHEMLFVLRGTMRLGARLIGPGTAAFIAADTFYGFTSGPEGLGFVNFRPARSNDILFASGGTFSEVGYWEQRVARPEYLVPC